MSEPEFETFGYCQNAKCKKLTNTNNLHVVFIRSERFLPSLRCEPKPEITKVFCDSCYTSFSNAMGINKNKDLTKQKSETKPTEQYYPSPDDRPNYSGLQILMKLSELESTGKTGIRAADIWDGEYSKGMHYIYLNWLTEHGYVEKSTQVEGVSKYTFNLTEKGQKYLNIKNKDSKTQKTTDLFHVISNDPYKVKEIDRSYGARP